RDVDGVACRGRAGSRRVSEPRLGRGPDALLLLFDVRHGVKNARSAGRAMVAAASKSRFRHTCVADARGGRSYARSGEEDGGLRPLRVPRERPEGTCPEGTRGTEVTAERGTILATVEHEPP